MDFPVQKKKSREQYNTILVSNAKYYWGIFCCFSQTIKLINLCTIKPGIIYNLQFVFILKIKNPLLSTNLQSKNLFHQQTFRHCPSNGFYFEKKIFRGENSSLSGFRESYSKTYIIDKPCETSMPLSFFIMRRNLMEILQ